MSDWIQSADGKETIRENSEAVIQRQHAEIERLRAAAVELADAIEKQLAFTGKGVAPSDRVRKAIEAVRSSQQLAPER